MGLTSWSTSNYLRKTTTVYGTEPFCFFGWIYIASAPGASSTAVQIGVNNNNPRYQMYVNSSPDIGLAATNGGFQAITASTNVTVGAWNHCLCGVISATSRVVERNAGSTNTGATSVAITTGAVWIGVRQFFGPTIDEAFPATGGIAEVSIWGGFMSQAEMQMLADKLYNGGMGQQGANPLNVSRELSRPWSKRLAAYWPLRSKDDLRDYSGNGHHLSMVGTVTNHASHPNIEPFIPSPWDRVSESLPYWLTSGEAAVAANAARPSITLQAVNRGATW